MQMDAGFVMHLSRVQSDVSQCLVYKLSLELQDLITQPLKRTMILSYTVSVQRRNRLLLSEQASSLGSVTPVLLHHLTQTYTVYLKVVADNIQLGFVIKIL